MLLDALINLPPLGLAALALGCFILAFIALYATHSSPPRALFSRARPDLKHHKNAVPLLGDMCVCITSALGYIAHFRMPPPRL